MNEFVLGLLVSKAVRAAGGAWMDVTGVLGTLALPTVETWGSAAGLLGVELPSLVVASAADFEAEALAGVGYL